MKKKILPLVLVFAMLVSVLSCVAYSVNFSDGLVELRMQWLREEGPLINGTAIDYSYYSPVRGEDDDTKYPLCIFMAGAGEGVTPGYELEANKYAYWSSSELQHNFRVSKGSFLLIARAPADPVICWDKAPLEPLKAAIDSFIEENPNVDVSRIYLVGWCLGGVGVTKLLLQYPGFFAAALIQASPRVITSDEAKKLDGTPIWLSNCLNDTYSIYSLYCQSSWDNLREQYGDVTCLRLTTCESAPDTSFLFQHDVWEYTALDCTQNGGCEGLKTVNGENRTVKTVRAIDWLSKWQLPGYDPPTPPDYEDEDVGDITGREFICTCDCHANNLITRIIFSLKIMLFRLFGLESYRICACGAEHW